ncbi:secretory pathway Sec39 [Pleomassaria siparia CBS 279.74]|uniref:Secretory pathway Sec39 n=1 Tax=Pleomassaria siparia CBS 279.74 TaxID=1314801 RepID=A0A6G1JSR3_9PLEO|nr:secretory pathway Sec39 [Pleomassaria siparia CBS 279.74]
MAELQALQNLSAAHCVLLAVHYAIESNIDALRALTALRENDFDLELTLRILLTYLPEAADSTQLSQYLDELVSDSRNPGDGALDTSPVHDLSTSQARKKRRKIEILPLAYPLYKTDTELDPLTQFLIHRAHRIDADTGLLDLVPPLIVPFLDYSEHLQTWFISTVLPLLRLGYEYYPQSSTPSLDEFTRLHGRRAIDRQLSYLRQTRSGGGLHTQDAARDFRGVLGPWICGASERKRRKISTGDRRTSISQQQRSEQSEPDDWECLFEWLAHTSKEDFPLVAAAIAEWDGPDDLDLGGYDGGHVYIDEEYQRRLELRYAQTAMACLYLVEKSNAETIQAAHSLLTRLSNLLSLDPPQELGTNTDSLPLYDLNSPILQGNTTTILQQEHILQPDNAITKPGPSTIRLLELFLTSASLLSSLEHPISVRDVARLYLRDEYAEQFSLLQRILHTLNSGSKKDGEQWKAIRSRLMWLWGWGTGSQNGDRHGQGVLGRLESKTIEIEILKALLESNHYSLAIQIYINTSGPAPLTKSDVQKVVLETAMHDYDNASNGNRTRGGMKKASEIVSTFSPHFPSSTKFQRTKALLAATHAMSFYTLILQHGVPFQPVNIRVSADPLSLLRKLLDQNSRSYTNLDDMVSIGQNLVVAKPSTLMDDEADTTHMDPSEIENKKVSAERRVTGMAIEAALKEDDFETAYSYVVNRLSGPNVSPAISPAVSTSSQRFSFGSFSSDKEGDEAEDVSWRAALLAGRYRSSPSTSWSGSAARPDLRRLEQRMELLSQALLLTPPSHLEEVLAVWQECEAEMNTLLAQEYEAEERFNDLADRRIPGSFTNETVAVQPRREVGRGATEESPMGLFDVARGAAAAFSKSAFPLRANATSPAPVVRDTASLDSSRVSMDFSDGGSASGADDRVRRRDMVASAVTGGLASGLGWVLGAKPVHERELE